MTAKFCGVGAPLAIAVKVLERLQLLPPVQRVGHRGDVGVRDLLPLQDLTTRCCYDLYSASGSDIFVLPPSLQSSRGVEALKLLALKTNKFCLCQFLYG